MTASACPEFAWCTDTNPAHLAEHFHGFSFDAVADESTVHVHVSLTTDPRETQEWSVWMDYSPWTIDADSDEKLGSEISREFANMRSVLHQIEARVRAFHAAHVGAPLKRQADVVDRMEALADH